MSATLHHGNVTEWARAYTGPRFHAVMCDPPYELGFMGRKWDSSGVAFSADTWAAIASVCKPGAMLLAFGGTRTFHRIAVAIEDAGWEIRDTVMWVYGQGFPKSHDVSKAIDREAGAQREVVGQAVTGAAYTRADKRNADAGFESGQVLRDITAPATAAAAQWAGYGTALKPAYEPVIVARLPLDGTVAQTAQTHGTGALAIDACRVGNETLKNSGMTSLGVMHDDKWEPREVSSVVIGRFPANLIHDGSDEVLTLFPDVGYSGGTQRTTSASWLGSRKKNEDKAIGYGDTGSAARFFYCAKASTSERDAGLGNMPDRSDIRINAPRESEDKKFSPRKNIHPTVKPLALTQYLARLILPPELDEPRRLFVPFAGSGSEVIGARRAGWDIVEGVELEAAHVDIARARVAHWEVAE